MIGLIFGPNINAFKNDQQQADAYAQRRIDVMKGNGEGKLNPGENFGFHGYGFVFQKYP